MRVDEVSREEQEFLSLITRNLWKARREGAIIGGAYMFCVLTMLYVAIAQLGLLHPISALCYGGVVVVAMDAYRRLFKRP